MTLSAALINLKFNSKPESVSDARWAGMIMWLQTRFKLNESLDEVVIPLDEVACSR